LAIKDTIYTQLVLTQLDGYMINCPHGRSIKPKVIQFIQVFMPTETKPVQLKRDKCKVVPGIVEFHGYFIQVFSEFLSGILLSFDTIYL